MNIIFGDIDGVFTNAKTGWYIFDITAVNFIRWICKVTGAKLVISSSWRYAHPKSFFENIFGKENLHKDWRTPVKLSSTRGDEIAMWLRSHPKIKDYLILDDDTDMHSDQMDHFVKTNIYDGMLSEHMILIMTHFGIDKTHNPWNGDNKMEYVIHKDMFDPESTKLIIQ